MNKHNRNRFTDNRNQTSGYPRGKGLGKEQLGEGVGTKLLGTNKHATNIWYTTQK